MDTGLFELKVIGHLKNLDLLSVRFTVNSHITAEQILMLKTAFTFRIFHIYEHCFYTFKQTCSAYCLLLSMSKA